MSTPQEQVNRPSIFDFTDYRAYLAAHYTWQRSLGTYSHRTFAQKAGLKSRSYMRLVLTGKRNLTPQSLAQFTRALEFKPSEANAFAALVNYNQARDFKTRKHYFDQFLRARPSGRKSHKIADVYQFLTRMAYPVVLSILNLPHIDHSFEHLSLMTGLKSQEIQEAIEVFLKLGVVSLNEGKVTLLAPCFDIDDSVPNVAMQSFHRNLLQKAVDHLEDKSRDYEYQAVIVALSLKEFQDVAARIRDWATEVNERYSSPHEAKTRICAVQMNLIPVTPELIRKTTNASQSSAKGHIIQEEIK
jgi:uncharacterized protein (TIGR02147 family)